MRGPDVLRHRLSIPPDTSVSKHFSRAHTIQAMTLDGETPFPKNEPPAWSHPAIPNCPTSLPDLGGELGEAGRSDPNFAAVRTQPTRDFSFATALSGVVNTVRPATGAIADAERASENWHNTSTSTGGNAAAVAAAISS